MINKYGFLSLGILMLCYAAYLMLKQNSINDWPVAAGIINESKWQNGSGRHGGIMIVRYTYKVDGIGYSSFTISPSYGDGHFFAINLEDRLKNNEEVDVCYSAKDHSKSYLKGFVNYNALLWIGGFGAVITVFGALISLGILKAAPIKRSVPWLNLLR
jgi:hypothetical protein